jgi:murein DD-endopeptidase MepM/ murein hydrolase activator NlpD
MKYLSPLKSNKARIIKRSVTGIAVFIFTLIIVVTYSKTVHAGLVSFMSSLWGSEQASAAMSKKSAVINSQNMDILQSHSSIHPTSNVVADVVPVDDGEALNADLAGANTGGDGLFNTQISTYVVREGDTVSGVAKMFNVSVNTLLWANNLTSKSVLRAGQNLVILPVTGITYTIKKGDTIQGIAKKYRADIDDILNYNDLTLTSALTIGQSVLIPDAELSTPTAVAKRTVRSVGFEPLLDGWNWPSIPGYFSCPVIGRLSQGLHGHNGIDLAAPVGTPLRASASGTVIISRSNGAWNGGYGNFVVISHGNGTQSLYAHMSRTLVSVGEAVSQGETIGSIGMTGLTTGPHVHFEIRGAQNPFGSGMCQ